jgi:hypothetical protein
MKERKIFWGCPDLWYRVVPTVHEVYIAVNFGYRNYMRCANKGIKYII